MSFKASKAKLKIFSKPLNKSFVKQEKISALAATALQLANSRNVVISKKEKIVEDENVATVENLDSSEIFSKLFKRGINPYRSEVVLINEFQPLATGNFSENDDAKSINLNFGNNKILEVTNVARLIDLQQTLRKNAISQSNFLIKRYGNIRINESQLITVMQNQLKSNKKFKKMYSSNLQNFKNNLILETKNSTRNARLSNQLKKLDNDYLNLVAEYVLNKYVAKEIILYIARLFDFKEKIEKGLELTTKPIVKANKYSGLNLKNSKSTNIKNLFGKGKANFNRNASNSFQNAMLSFARKNSKNDLNRSNFENLLNLTSHMISVIYCYDTIDDLTSKNYIENENIVYGRSGNLKSALNKLSKITFKGCFSERNVAHPAPGPENQLTETTLQSVYSRIGSDNNSIATAEMISAICFNQVCWSNFRKKQNNVPLSEKVLSLNQFINEYFVKLDQPYRPDTVLDGTSFRSFKEAESRKGKFIKRLFNKRTYKGKDYIPFETNNTLSSKLYNQSLSFPAEEIYFTSAIKNNDKTFSEFKKFTEDIDKLMNEINEHLINNMSVDFDDQGNQTSTENTIIDNLNPLSYFNFYLKSLADEIEEAFSNSTRAKQSLPGLGICLSSAGDFDSIADSFIGAITGIVYESQEFWANDSWIKNSDQDGYQAGSRVAATLLSEAKFRTGEGMQRLITNAGISMFGEPFEKFGLTGLGFDTTDGNGYPFGENSFSMREGSSERYNIGVSSDFHFNPKFDSDAENTSFWEFAQNPVSSDSTEDVQIKFNYGNLYTSAPSTLAAYLNLSDETITEDKANAQPSSAPRVNNTLLESNFEELDDRLNSTIGGTKAAGNQFTVNSTFLSRVLFDSALGKHNPDDDTPLPGISFDNSQIINRFENMFFFKAPPSIPGLDSVPGSMFETIDKPGTTGEMFRTSSIQRSLIFYIYALGLLSSTQRMSFSIQKSTGHVYFSYKESRITGLLKAMKGEDLASDAPESEKHAYEEALERIDLVKSRIIKRQDYILRCAAILNDKVDSLVSTYKNLINFSEGSTAGRSFPLVKSKLDENNFFDDTFGLLNASYKDYLSNSYLRNFCRSNNARYSYFLESDTFHNNDLKIMYKVLAQPNYGFLQKEKLGRKNIFHVGVPLGLLEYLRREAYKETGDEDYLDSSLIVISVYKNNQISTDTKYLPKQFIFDMSKHILPFYCDYNGNVRYSRHVKRMTDDLSLDKIIKNMEIYVFNEASNFGFKSNGYGKAGIVGNKTSDTSNNYENENEFATDVIRNQIFDYYLKLYTSLTTSLEVNETMFTVDADKTFTGEVDSTAGTNFKNKILSNVIRRYPKITEIPDQSERFFRAANSLNNSILLSSNNRLKEMLSISCFERVFSIFINERDFLLEHKDAESIFIRSPKINRTSKIQRTPVNPFYVSKTQNKVIRNYLRELNDKHTSMVGFSIDIGLLKKW